MEQSLLCRYMKNFDTLGAATAAERVAVAATAVELVAVATAMAERPLAPSQSQLPASPWPQSPALPQLQPQDYQNISYICTKVIALSEIGKNFEVDLIEVRTARKDGRLFFLTKNWSRSTLKWFTIWVFQNTSELPLIKSLDWQYLLKLFIKKKSLPSSRALPTTIGATPKELFATERVAVAAAELVAVVAAVAERARTQSQ
ncbi:hypothetical protein TIFTF001_021491 [Ficus carica]|uniref:Uncharacterized protein n=1 Tax=Ficus carica TaxID=3494 RepID=A0AA88AI21_FICCA|nr:hypothetical protein TIFTF001_021491 [Ficus carica]